jgi:hypothetical protein
VINESLKATTLPVFPEEPVGPTPEEIAAKQVTKIRSVELALEYVNITSGTFEPPDPTVGYVISVATDFYNYIIAP